MYKTDLKIKVNRGQAHVTFEMFFPIESHCHVVNYLFNVTQLQSSAIYNVIKYFMLCRNVTIIYLFA